MPSLVKLLSSWVGWLPVRCVAQYRHNGHPTGKNRRKWAECLQRLQSQRLCPKCVWLISTRHTVLKGKALYFAIRVGHAQFLWSEPNAARRLHLKLMMARCCNPQRSLFCKPHYQSNIFAWRFCAFLWHYACHEWPGLVSRPLNRWTLPAWDNVAMVWCTVGTGCSLAHCNIDQMIWNCWQKGCDFTA